jgi:glycosyltransferase involved in cell wall biosynthesis
VPRLSVLTPSYGYAHYLGELLDSVAALRTDHEHVVYDGNSTDGTPQLLAARRDPALFWASEPDRGYVDAINKAIRKAGGDLLMWVNADNAVIPDAVDRCVAYLDAHPEVDATYAGMHIIDAAGDVRRVYVPGEYSWTRYLFIGDYIPTETIIFRRALLDRVPQVAEERHDGADYDFYLRLLHTRHVERFAEPVIRYRHHDEAKTGADPFIAQAEHLRVRLDWARGPRDRVLMKAIDEAKRFLLPRISPWPKPYPEDAPPLEV